MSKHQNKSKKSSRLVPQFTATIRFRDDSIAERACTFTNVFDAMHFTSNMRKSYGSSVRSAEIQPHLG